MRRLRRHAAGIAALVALGVAALLVVVAVDARTWQRTLARDDLRFRALPAHRALWQPATILPGDPAGKIVGTGGALSYREALQLFWFSRVGVNAQLHRDLLAVRADTQQRLDALASSGAPAAERSNAANLLGVLVVTTPIGGNDQSAIAQLLRSAAAQFRRAIAIDPADVDAKQNLELVLRVTRPGQGSIGRDANSGYGFGRGRGAAPIGSGY